MNVKFNNSDEVYINSVILYAKKNDNYIYEDAACTMKLNKDTVLNLCEKGLALISYEGAVYPVAAYKSNTVKKCLDITIYDVLASTAAAVTVHSSEYTA